MAFNKNPEAFADCKGAFEHASSSPNGIRIKCDTPSAATRLRHRMNYFRLHFGKGSFNGLSLRLEGSEIVVEHNSVERLKIEEIQ